MIAITIGVSIFIEVMQYITQLGVFDIDDIILNTIGALIGFVLVKVIKF